MFNGSKPARDSGGLPPAPPAASSKRATGAGQFSVLGADVTITGNIAATADLHIDGHVDGDVTCGALTQGGDSEIRGSVTAESARIAGTIEGKVRARQLIIERTARVAGDVEYEAITIESGAQVDGGLKRITSLNLAQPANTLRPRETITQEIIEEPQLLA